MEVERDKVGTFGQLLMGTLLAIALGYWGWAGVQIVRLNGKVQEMQAQLKSFDGRCLERLEWMEKLDEKLDEVVGDTREIKGLLKGRGDER